MSGTKDRILDTAERLFAEDGYEGTSLRRIIAEAGVNLASVHYYFRSKEALLDAVVVRRIGPINEERLSMLDKLEREAASGPLPVEGVLEAFILPVFAARQRSPQLLKLIGRIQSDGSVIRIMRTHFREVVTRFVAAFRRAAPDLPVEELVWRIHFSIGAMAHALRGSPDMESFAGLGGRRWRTTEISERLVRFLGAGFHAPPLEKP
jgi:AcrR family transcriptional regulator